MFFIHIFHRTNDYRTNERISHSERSEESPFESHPEFISGIHWVNELMSEWENREIMKNYLKTRNQGQTTNNQQLKTI